MARAAAVIFVFVLSHLGAGTRAEVSESLRVWHNSVAKPPLSRFKLSCNTSFTIRDEKPLGMGYKQAAWRARDDGRLLSRKHRSDACNTHAVSHPLIPSNWDRVCPQGTLGYIPPNADK